MALCGPCHCGGLLAVYLPRPVWAPPGLAAKGSVLLMIFLMFGAHAVCDFPLQGQFLSDAKNHLKPVPGVPWYQALLAHGLIHGALVAAITGRVELGLCELVVHIVTDYLKCSNRLSFNQDQAIHYACKILWGVL